MGLCITLVLKEPKQCQFYCTWIRFALSDQSSPTLWYAAAGDNESGAMSFRALPQIQPENNASVERTLRKLISVLQELHELKGALF